MNLPEIMQSLMSMMLCGPLNTAGRLKEQEYPHWVHTVQQKKIPEFQFQCQHQVTNGT
jgi:hypothetical protein